MPAAPGGQAATDVAAPAPVNPDERLHLVDALRGFALLGVFVVNVGDFALFPVMAEGTRADLPLGAMTRVAEIASLVFLRAKFYTIFSFLFGLGFSMMLLRAAGRGAAFPQLYRRRLAVLLLLGLAHMTLIWHGDILTVYALVGFLLPLFVRVTDRGLLTWAAVMFAAPAVLRALVVVSGGALDPGAPLRAASQWTDRRLLGEMDDAALLALLQSGDWVGLLKHNLAGPLFRFSELLSSMRVPRVLGAFLLGMWAGRRRIFEDPGGRRAFVRRVLIWGLPIGLAASGVQAAMSSPERPLHAPVRIVEDLVSAGAVPLALAYVAAFVLLWLRPVWRRWLTLLAPAGRMALTNYLAQSLIGIFVFYGVGLGLGGRVGSAVAATIAAGVFLLQVAASALWLHRYRYGPAEWLWRSLTYGRRQAFRRG